VKARTLDTGRWHYLPWNQTLAKSWRDSFPWLVELDFHLLHCKRKERWNIQRFSILQSFENVRYSKRIAANYHIKNYKITFSFYLMIKDFLNKTLNMIFIYYYQ
jgi:hypothetical protein